MQHFSRRLVWGAYGDGRLELAFRVAEDGSFAGIEDTGLEVSRDLAIAIAHPLPLGADACTRWGTLFGDYEIVQPFAQLARELFVLTSDEHDKTSLRRFEGRRVEGSRFFGLRHRGWEFVDYHLGKRLSDGRVVTLETSPGLDFLAQKPEEQTLGALELHAVPGADATFRSVDPLEASELLRDVELLLR
jgi:hypothetical protein